MASQLYHLFLIPHTLSFFSHLLRDFKKKLIFMLLMSAIFVPDCRNPYFRECVASYGGPVLPHVVLGGFLGPKEFLSKDANFLEADTLVITFPIDNYFNKSLLEPALQWEKV